MCSNQRVIILANGTEVNVDPEDYKRFGEFPWSGRKKRGGTYAGYSKWNSIKKRPDCIYLHRIIMNANADQTVVFLNGNSLDCRKSNLLVCEGKYARRFQRHYSYSATGFKGVSKYHRKFIAQITYNNECIRLGVFDNPLEAAEAYNQKAIELYKDKAILNQT
jgi:hypothetical protein